MTPLVPAPALRQIARRVVWFREPDEALADPRHFLAHVMTYGTAEDLAVVRAVVPDRTLRAVLDDAPPGIFDARSWAHWHLVLARRSPPPPLPERAFLRGLA